jgi:hypothetical protein
MFFHVFPSFIPFAGGDVFYDFPLLIPVSGVARQAMFFFCVF